MDTAHIGRLCARADGVAAWGGEAALRAIRQHIPDGCRWIEWGHRISFAYLTPPAAQPEALDVLVDEICRLDQQACSSPQWLLVDSDDPDVLRGLGQQLADAFQRRSPCWPGLTPTVQEASEITARSAMARLDQCFAGHVGHVWNGAGWRVIWEHHHTLMPSPLFRTLLLRPVPRHRLTETLLPWRNVLQSCALICPAPDARELVQALVGAGVSRVAPCASIHDGYAGEPHDGVYALTRLSRRVSVSLPDSDLSRRMTLDAALPAPDNNDVAIMDKQAFMAQPIDPAAQLYFRSGGSSGTPALAGFSYDDFERQMQAAADGLFAAGLDPARDRVMNLFYGGSLYGGFLSFAKILERMKVTHLPMGAPQDDDFSEVARMIVAQRVNVLIGMPSTLHRLFLKEERALRAYAGVHTVFLGGEHLGQASRQLMASCGVTTIRSAIYGSVDAGPLGHACALSAEGVFHLMGTTQHLEIVELQHDAPVQGTEVGRLIFTSRAREGQNVRRYEVGDTGRHVHGECPCGLDSPRFELLQRHGHLVRIATEFIPLAELAHSLGAPVQMVLDQTPQGGERLMVITDADTAPVMALLRACAPLANAIDTGLLIVEIHASTTARLQRNPHSGKMPLVIDRRK